MGYGMRIKSNILMKVQKMGRKIMQFEQKQQKLQ